MQTFMQLILKKSPDIYIRKLLPSYLECDLSEMLLFSQPNGYNAAL